MKKPGFTLSEVLITLAIIGIVAAITVPMLMNNTNGQEYRTAIKKAISGLNQAIALNFALEGLTAQDYTSSDDIVQNLFKKRMNNIKMPSDTQFTSSKCPSEANSIFTTTDGIIFCVTNYKSDASDEKGSKCDFYNQTPCIEEDGANIWIDVNGVKKPNKITTSSQRPRDIYQAQIYSQKVVPYGEPTQSILYDDEVKTGDNEGNENLNNNQEKPSKPEEPQKPNKPEEPQKPNKPEEPQKPNKPENPSNKPDKDDVDSDNTPDEDNPYYDQYDPNKWPNWLDFLKWLWDWLMGIIP